MADPVPQIPANFSNLDLEQAIKRANPRALDGLNPKKKAELLTAFKNSLGVQVTASMQSLRIAPMPTPEDLEKYKLVDPKFSTLIGDMAEKEQNFGHLRDAEIRKREFWLKTSGQIFAFIITMSSLGGGLYVIMNGHEVAGTIFSGLGLTGLVSLFLRAKQK
jgi:uncharacterized membrane protein